MFIVGPSEESGADTEGNKIPRKQKRRKPRQAEDGASSGVTAARDTSKGEFFIVDLTGGQYLKDFIYIFCKVFDSIIPFFHHLFLSAIQRGHVLS